MQLKLVMAYGGDLGWMLRSGSILKWHKTEGDEVRYGDELFDLRVEEIAIHPAALERRLIRQKTFRGWTDQNSWAEQTGMKNMTVKDIDPDSPMISSKRPFSVRVTSSDHGILRKVYAKERERREAGDLLAILTTKPDELIDDEASQTLNQASVFRVVVNRLLDPDGYNRSSDTILKGSNFIIFWSEQANENRIGIYSQGGFAANPVFGVAPLIRPKLKGKCCIIREGLLALRSDLLVQSLGDHPQMDDLAARLSLPAGSLRPDLFEKTILVNTTVGQERFPKTVVVLSIASDVESFCFRHNDSGLLVPPEAAYKLASIEDLESFQKNFTPVGKLSVEGFLEHFSRVVPVLQKETGAHVIVFNSFSSGPRAATHNYRFLDDHDGMRRLEFNLALTELSRKLDFSILDMDRILKKSGIADQLDWDSVAPALYQPVAGEAYRIMRERGLVQ